MLQDMKRCFDKQLYLDNVQQGIGLMRSYMLLCLIHNIQLDHFDFQKYFLNILSR